MINVRCAIFTIDAVLVFGSHLCKRGKIYEFNDLSKKTKYHMCMKTVWFYFNCWQAFSRNHCSSSCWQQQQEQPQQYEVSVIFPREIVMMMTLDNDWVWHPIRSVILLPASPPEPDCNPLLQEDPGGNQSSKLAWESLSISVRMYIEWYTTVSADNFCFNQAGPLLYIREWFFFKNFMHPKITNLSIIMIARMSRDQKLRLL